MANDEACGCPSAANVGTMPHASPVPHESDIYTHRARVTPLSAATAAPAEVQGQFLKLEKVQSASATLGSHSDTSSREALPLPKKREKSTAAAAAAAAATVWERCKQQAAGHFPGLPTGGRDRAPTPTYRTDARCGSGGAAAHLLQGPDVAVDNFGARPTSHVSRLRHSTLSKALPLSTATALIADADTPRSP